MPRISCAVEETVNHIFYPVIQQLSHRLLDTLAYREIIGNAIYINTDWSTHSKTSNDENDAIVNRQALRIEANIQLNPTSQKYDVYGFQHTAAYGLGDRQLNDHYPLYIDKDNFVKIAYMSGPVTITLNCELVLQSTELAFKSPIQIFNGHETGSIYTYNDLFFDYPVPKPILHMLYELWKLDRVKGQPVGKSFVEFLSIGSGGTWNYVKNKVTDDYEVVIPVYDLMALSVLEYSDDKPNSVMNERMPTAYSIPFTFTVQFAVPNILTLMFPPVYCNQLIPEAYIPKDTSSRFNNMLQSRHWVAMEGFVKEHTEGYARYLQIPSYDDWSVPQYAYQKKTKMSPVGILLITLDEDTEDGFTRIKFDKEIVPYAEWSDLVIHFLNIQNTKSLRYDCVYNVSLYRDDKPLIPGEDFFFKDMELYFKPISLIYRYRIAVSVATELRHISEEWYDELKKHYKDLPPFLQGQIKEEVEHGSWRDPSWKPGTHIDGNGDIWGPDQGRYPLPSHPDLRPVVPGDYITNIKDHKYPKGGIYAGRTTIYSLGNTIRTRKASFTSSGNTNR